MGLFMDFLTAVYGPSSTQIKETNQNKYYHVLVASALNEELAPFLEEHKGKWKYLDHERKLKTFIIKNSKNTSFNILTYSPDKMGAPVNAVTLTDVIKEYNIRFVIFIGTCAGLHPENNKEGDVLVPEYVYAYDSGKYDDKGNFKVEHRHYDLSQQLRTMLSDWLRTNPKYKFKVEQNCGFCSGASVVSSQPKRNQIIKGKNRKVAGFDMEAYSLAVINQFCSQVDTIVIKGIMDFGIKKDDKYKDKAKKNCSIVANDLLKYVVEHIKTEL